MTPEAQRIAIAEACGIKDHGERDGYFRFADGKGHNYSDVSELPDYLNDLNAMHEAEFTLTPAQRRDYAQQVMTDICAEGEWTSDEDWALLTTTAAQRAEAFLKTTGKWKD